MISKKEILEATEFVDNRADKEQSGWEEDNSPKPCLNPGHNPTTHLYIPPGRIYRHVCPACGYTVRLTSPQIIY